MAASSASRQSSLSAKKTGYYRRENVSVLDSAARAAPGEKSTRIAGNEKLLLTCEEFTKLVLYTPDTNWDGVVAISSLHAD